MAWMDKYKNILEQNSKYKCWVIEITFQNLYAYLSR
jgi:hypothetical protein